MDTWTVVKFQDENTVEAVPTSWVNEDKCYWPPFKNREKLNSSIKKAEKPQSCWSSFKVERFKSSTYDNYITARSKAKKAEVTSDLNTDLDEPFVRKKRAPNTYSSSSEDSDEMTTRSPPQIQEVAIVESSQLLMENRVDTPVEAIGCTPSTISKGISNMRNEKSAIEDSCCCCPIHPNVRYLKEILSQQHILRVLISDLSTLLSSTRQHFEPTDSVLSKFRLPLHRKDELLELEEFLEDSDNFKKAMIELSKLGGGNTYDFIKRALSLLLTNTLAATYSWLGRRTKMSFSITNMARLLTSAADEGKIASSKKETEIAIQSWLKRAKERANREEKTEGTNS